MVDTSVTNLGDVTVSAALSFIVANAASVGPVPFRHVSRASGCFNSDESFAFLGRKRVRIGTMR